MIAEIWSGRVRAERRAAVATELQAAIQEKMKATSACRGAYLLQRQLERGEYEILLLTLYEPERDSARNGAPPSSDFGDTLTRYEVVTDPVRTLLYAELSRRFPPRSMAPR